jgi:hypothetical protein
LFNFARLSMAEEATRFAVSLVRLQGADMRVANRPSVLDQCAQLLERHLGGEGGKGEDSPYRLDVSRAAVNAPAKQVGPSHHSIVCEDRWKRGVLDIIAALPPSGGGPCRILALSSWCSRLWIVVRCASCSA